MKILKVYLVTNTSSIHATKFLTFMQCTFDESWKVIPINELPAEKQYVTENMDRLRSEDSGATAILLDMLYKEIRITFKKTAVVGVGNVMFYCPATEVVDTTINDSPMTLNF